MGHHLLKYLDRSSQMSQTAGAGGTPLQTGPCTPAAARHRDILLRARTRVLAEAAAVGVRNIAVVGSVARGDAGWDSDIDLLVDVDDEVTLFQLVEFQKCLRDILQAPVDIIERASVTIGLDHLEGEAIVL